MSENTKTSSRLKILLYALKKNYSVAPAIFLLLMAANTASAALGYLPALISRNVLNMLQTLAPYDRTIGLIACMIPAAVLIKLAETAGSILSLRQNDVFEQKINEEILRKNAKLDPFVYDTPKYFDTISDLDRSKRAFNRLNTQAMRFGAATLNLGINIAVVTHYSSFLYVLIMLVFLIPAVLFSSRYENQKNRYEINSQSTLRKISYYARIMTERTSAQEIRFYNLSDSFIKKYEDLSIRHRDGIKKISLTYGLMDSFAKALPEIGTGIVLTASAINVANGHMLIGDFFFLISVVSGLQMHVMQLAFHLAITDVNCHAVKKYEDYLALPEISNSGERLLDRIERIEFRNVSFTYPNSNHYVLHHVSFTLNPHEKTALVGVNGAGKTTIAKLLMHFYDVSDGEIRINDYDIREYELVSLRRKIAPDFKITVFTRSRSASTSRSLFLISASPIKWKRP